LVEAEELATKSGDDGVGNGLGGGVLMLVLVLFGFVECRFADGNEEEGSGRRGGRCLLSGGEVSFLPEKLVLTRREGQGRN